MNSRIRIGIYISQKERKDEFWDKDINSILTHLKSNAVLFISQLLNVTLSVIFSLNSWWENMCFSRCLPICCWIGYIWMRVAAFLLLKITSLSPFLLSFQLEIGEMAIKLVLLLLSSLLKGELDICDICDIMVSKLEFWTTYNIVKKCLVRTRFVECSSDVIFVIIPCFKCWTS